MFEISAFSLESVDPQASGVTDRVRTQPLLACFHELFGPRVEVIGFYAFTTTQLVDCDLESPPRPRGSSLLWCISCEWLTEPAERTVGCLCSVLQQPRSCLEYSGSRVLLTKCPTFAEVLHPGYRERFNYEHKRNGTRNLFMFFEPLRGW